MFEKRKIEKQTQELLSFLKACGFQEPLTRRISYITVFSYLAESIGIEVELDWLDKSVFVQIVRLESGHLPDGYYVSKSDGMACRIPLQTVLYKLGYRDEEINVERLHKKRKKKQVPPSFERMESMLEATSNLLKRTIDLIISKQESIFNESAI